MFDQIIERQKPPVGAKPMARQFIANVFSYMFSALIITAVVAWWFYSNKQYMTALMSESGSGLNALGYIVMFAPIGLVLLIQTSYQRFSMTLLVVLFIVYSALLGMSLSFIFLVYSLGSIATVFFITAATFGAMALLGYTTKTDLAKFGGIMYMLFIGIFIASIANFFMQSGTMSYIISFIGVFVFTGLTAYEMQRLKYMSSYVEYGSIETSKLALIGGLQLYILFINLFLSLLRLFGSRD